MRALERLLMVGLIGGVCVGSVRAGTIRYRADLEVTRALSGIGIGQTGSLFVEHADDLPDQYTTLPYHEHRGDYGYPDDPPIEMLWSFGGRNAVQPEGGFISVTDGPYPAGSSDRYTIMSNKLGNAPYPDAILKGKFAGKTFTSAKGVLLRDTTGTAIGDDALAFPVFDDYDVPQTGSLVFFGINLWLGYDVKDIVPISAADAAARFTAGSPASLTQPIATPATSFDIGFDYSFDAAAVAGGATLQVSLDGVLQDTINASLADVVQSAAVSVTDGALGNQSAVDLEFLFNGPTGSTMLLDNVAIPGSDLLNGDFQTHSLAAWDIGGPGSVGLYVIPEPGTLTLLVLAALGLVVRFGSPAVVVWRPTARRPGR